MNLYRDVLKKGEVIRAKDVFGLMPETTSRVEEHDDNLIHLSAGESRFGVSPMSLPVIERNLPEPASWLRVQVTILRERVRQCDCQDCRKLLKQKERELAKEKLH
jgi:hypothetical protein